MINWLFKIIIEINNGWQFARLQLIAIQQPILPISGKVEILFRAGVSRLSNTQTGKGSVACLDRIFENFLYFLKT